MPVLCYTVWNLCTDTSLFPPGTEEETEKWDTQLQHQVTKQFCFFSRISKDFQCPYLFIVLMNTAWAHSLHRSWKPDEAEMFIDLSALHTYSPLDWEYITHKYLCVYSWRQDVLVVLGSTPSAKSTFMLFCSYIVLLIFMDKYWNEIDVLFCFSFGSHMSFSSGFTFSDSCSGNNSIQCRELQHN